MKNPRVHTTLKEALPVVAKLSVSLIAKAVEGMSKFESFVWSNFRTEQMDEAAGKSS